MDLRSDDEVLVTAKAEKSRTGGGETVSDKSSISSSDLGSKKDGGNTSNKDLFLRADKIDFKSWDIQLDKHLSRVISRDREVNTNTKKEDWEIELSKLDIRSVIAHGTYGTVYRGVYDGQDVAGTLRFLYASISIILFPGLNSFLMRLESLGCVWFN